MYTIEHSFSDFLLTRHAGAHDGGNSPSRDPTTLVVPDQRYSCRGIGCRPPGVGDQEMNYCSSA